jgi:homoserine dehydrogenase
MKVAILGLGTVGSGVLKILQDNQLHIQEQIGEPVEVTHIYGRSFKNIHDCNLSTIKPVEDIKELLEADIDVVIEVLGGVDFPYEIYKRFLNKGIHVVSANKDLLAQHIDELAELANQNKAQLKYEAAVAGGIPIIHNLRYTLRANQLSRVSGILNGTTNYILTKMTNEGLDFHEALAEASKKGYAEADPTNDVDGYDAQRKIALLSRLAYNRKIKLAEVEVEGIRNVKAEDIEIGSKHGYILKLLGVSEFDGEQMEISVQPTFVPKTHQLATVSEAMNGVFAEGNAVGETMFYGPGAGSLETASAIIADVMEIAERGYVGNPVPKQDAKITTGSAGHSYYVRFNEEAESNEQTLKDLNIDHKELAGDHAFTVQTAPLTKDKIEDIRQKANVATIYRIL